VARALVIGAGPAGLMAAEVLARAGHAVEVAEAKPSPARKFLMAGKSGLNLTKAEPQDAFRAAYAEAAVPLAGMLDAFGPDDVCKWAEDLGQPLFTGSTGRVFPVAMKGSPLLRAWLARLQAAGVVVHRRWRWTGWADGDCQFDTPDGPVTRRADATVLALGGASWARLGSDGTWAKLLAAEGVPLTPFAPANCGFRVAWSNHMARHFGQPVKGAALVVKGAVHRGEFVISARGVEGGGIYAVARDLRDGAELTLDLAPDLTVSALAERLSRPRGKASLANHLRKAARFDPVRVALLNEFARPLPDDPRALAQLAKALPVPLAGPRPLDEAISTAGGVAWAGVDSNLMLRARPGTFAAGEMLDWEAPTGGYLLTACFATGAWAGQGAAAWLEANAPA
tara:strand:+ start:50 stop:1240 length:1191 start_codon:yes stop_codon:yes gene_type:complete